MSQLLQFLDEGFANKEARKAFFARLRGDVRTYHAPDKGKYTAANWTTAKKGEKSVTLFDNRGNSVGVHTLARPESRDKLIARLKKVKAEKVGVGAKEKNAALRAEASKKKSYAKHPEFKKEETTFIKEYTKVSNSDQKGAFDKLAKFHDKLSGGDSFVGFRKDNVHPYHRAHEKNSKVHPDLVNALKKAKMVQQRLANKAGKAASKRPGYKPWTQDDAM